MTPTKLSLITPGTDSMQRWRWFTLVLAGIFLLAFALAGCGPRLTKERFDQVKSGMTEAEVKAILGEPQKSEAGSFLGISGTAYEYSEGSVKADIVFVNGKVMTTNWSSGEGKK